MKIAHIFSGTLAFSDGVIRLFDKTGYENHYFITMSTDDGRSSSLARKRTVKVTVQEIVDICIASTFDVFIFHSLPGYLYDSVLSIPQNRKIIVSSWGYDIYESQNGCQPICSLPLYKPDTLALLKNMEEQRKRRIRQESGLFRTMLRPLKRCLLHNHNKRLHLYAIEKQRAVLGRIDFWASVLPTEYDILKTIPVFNAAYFPFQYPLPFYPETHTVPNGGEMILVGNSATPSNNHLDILHLLKDRRISNPVHIPAAYGDNTYLQELENLLPDCGCFCHVQKEFLSPADYNGLLANCKAAVFGHIRQQALGNIYLCLSLGKKVFLWRDSLAYRFLNQLGCHIFTIEDNLTPLELQKPLSEAETRENRELISTWTSEDLLFSRMKATLDIIAEECL